MESYLCTLCIVMAGFCVSFAENNAPDAFFGYVPVKHEPKADKHPNDIYTDYIHREPKVLDGFNIFYKDVGFIKYYTKDPEGADYEFRKKGTPLIPKHELDRVHKVPLPHRKPSSNPFIPHHKPAPPRPIVVNSPKPVLPPRRSPPAPRPSHQRPSRPFSARPSRPGFSSPSTHLIPPPRFHQRG